MKKYLLFGLVFVLGVISFVVPLKNINAQDNNDRYSIDYLLRNYSAVTFGAKDNNILSIYQHDGLDLIKGDILNTTFEGSVLARGNYPNKVNENVDFDKMYVQVLNESNMLLEKSENLINEYSFSVNKPGIYTIKNSAKSVSSVNYGTRYYNDLLIYDYDPNSYYIFNVLDTYANNNFMVKIASSEQPYEKFESLVSSGRYTGNIIFNYPNARYLSLFTINGNIIAPSADVYIDPISYEYFATFGYKCGTVLSNSITYPYYGENTIVKEVNYSGPKILNESVKKYCVDNKNYNDDYYYGDYSLASMLKNYNVVSLGMKENQPNTKIASKGYKKGSTGIFHIVGQFLVNGDLGIEGENYPGYTENDWDYVPVYGKMRFDLDGDKVVESYFDGEFKAPFYIKSWPNRSYADFGSRNRLFEKTNTNYEYYYGERYDNGLVKITDSFINFDRLYNNIIREQSAIDDGKKAKVGEDHVVHIPIGGNYVIDDISNVEEIMFDNFEKNKNEITIVTIKNSGNINFPIVSKDTGSYKGILTNDYYGKKRPDQEYEMRGLIPDEYYGNIIFNVPNANYIKLAPNAPFAGHLVAPNADVESEETQIAGCMIVNSLYAEGGTEAHFYPLTAFDNCECSVEDQVPDELKTMFNNMRLRKLLGGESSTLEQTVIGDQVQYNKDTELLNNIINSCPEKNNASIAQILTNPKTYSTIGIVLGVIVIAFVGYKIINNKKRQLN